MIATATRCSSGETNSTIPSPSSSAFTGVMAHGCFNRTQILDAVWGYEADVGGERTVNVHIRRLREKIELDPSRPSLILTVPGIGYRLSERAS